MRPLFRELFDEICTKSSLKHCWSINYSYSSKSNKQKMHIANHESFNYRKFCAS